MFDVCVYLSSLPRIADRERKVMALRAFVEGVRACGATVLEQQKQEIVQSQLAVILGWYGSKIKGPHIQLRKDVINKQATTGRKIMPIDGSCFKFADPGSVFLRYSLGGVYYNTNDYANSGSDDRKWLQISSALNIGLQDWRTNGNHILLCLQRDTGWSMKGVDMSQWALDTVRDIRRYTNRLIVVRPHPKNPVKQELFAGQKNVTFSGNTLLQQDLKNAWASVFFNSSSCVASILAGVPVFVSDDDCVAWTIANRDLSQIENPTLISREQWLYDLSAAHWTDQESSSGKIYQHFLPRITNP